MQLSLKTAGQEGGGGAESPGSPVPRTYKLSTSGGLEFDSRVRELEILHAPWLSQEKKEGRKERKEKEKP